MPRPHRNLFYPVLGIVGFAFTITAASYCVSVLRGVRPETARHEPHALQQLMDRHGTSILVGELVLLAIATVGAVGLDHVQGERIRAARDAERKAMAPDADSEATRS
jgi:hypothetical protein